MSITNFVDPYRTQSDIRYAKQKLNMTYFIVKTSRPVLDGIFCLCYIKFLSCNPNSKAMCPQLITVLLISSVVQE